MSDYHLTEHFQTVQRFFLMEAGDTMLQFYSDIFQRVGGSLPSLLHLFVMCSLCQSRPSKPSLCSVQCFLPESLWHVGIATFIFTVFSHLLLTDSGRTALAGPLLPQRCVAGGVAKPVPHSWEEVYTLHVSHMVVSMWGKREMPAHCQPFSSYSWTV